VALESEEGKIKTGLADLNARLTSAGLSVLKQDVVGSRRYFVVGVNKRLTDFEVSETFLKALPATLQYREAIDSYATAVTGRAMCGPPEFFHCRSGTAVQIEVLWPIVVGPGANSWLSFRVANLVSGMTAKCSVCLTGIPSWYPKSIFDHLSQSSSLIRTAVDTGEIRFYKTGEHPEEYQQVKRTAKKATVLTPLEVQEFLASKVYMLGFVVPETPGQVWIVDPWDAEYLGIYKKDLALAARVLQANGFIALDESSSYAQTTDKLIAQQNPTLTKPHLTFTPPSELTLQGLPKAEDLNS
jgi:hypothetical protein